MKRKFLLSLALLICFSPLALLAAYDLHCIFSGRPQLCTIQLLPAFQSLCAIGAVRKLFFILLGIFLLSLLLMLSDRKPEYKSEMQEVIPGLLETPKAAGQGQYGTAKWLQPEQFPTAFHAVLLDRNAPLLQELIEHGMDDLLEVNTDEHG